MKRVCFVVLSTIMVLFLSLAASAELTTMDEQEGNVIYTSYIDENGKVTFNKSAQCAVVKKVLDQNGNPVEEYYLDEFRNPLKKSAGFYGVKRIYEMDPTSPDFNRCTEFWHVGRDGEPVMISSGYSYVVRRLDEGGRTLEQYYYDTEHEPVCLAAGYYGQSYTYDENGYNDSTTYLNIDGDPVTIPAGYSMVRYERNNDGVVRYHWYYGADGAPSDIGRGQFGIQLIYRDGVYTSSVPVDLDGNELFYVDQYLGRHPEAVFLAVVASLLILLFAGKPLCILLLGMYIGFIIYMTLLCRETGESKTMLEVFWSYRKFFTDPSLSGDLVNNILLFVPFGAFFASAIMEERRRVLLKVLLAGAMLSAFVELLQYIYGLGLCEVDDVINNTLGACIGGGGAMLIRKIRRQRQGDGSMY